MNPDLLLFILFVVSLVAYFLPSIMASSRDHNNTAAIFILNLFLGWTFVGWVIALVWSFTDNVEKPIDIQAYNEINDIPKERKEPPFKND